MRLLVALACVLALLIGAADARTKRSSAVRCQFLKSQGYPDCRTPKGMVVDHRVPLACGGPDALSNLQLIPIEAARIKDRKALKECRR